MFLKYNIWGLLWVFLILILCSLPGKQLPPGPFINFDKLVHLFFYSTLQLLLMRGFILQSQFPVLRKHYIILTATFSTLFGVFIEIMQGFILKNRSFDTYDITANIVGVALGILIWIIFLQKKIKSKMS